MPIFILVRQLVLLVCINSALIMSPPARTLNKTPFNLIAKNNCLHVTDWPNQLRVMIKAINFTKANFQ